MSTGACLTLASRFDQIDPALERLAATYDSLGYDDETREHIDLALREALANAILHGNRTSPEKQVQVEAAIEGRELVFRVVDQGAGFDPDRVPDPREPENLLKPGGRGLLLMRAFMDRVEFHYLPGIGMEATLRKALPH